MWFSMDVIQARKGDCLMLHYGSKDDQHRIIIDGGPSKVFVPNLEPRIRKIRKALDRTETKPLDIDLILVSHVDDDHIKGILELTNNLRNSKLNRALGLLRVGGLWHNTFDDFLKTTPKVLQSLASCGLASEAGEIVITNADQYHAAHVLQSIPQGRTLRDDARFLEWKVNSKFKEGLILAAKGAKPVPVPGGLKVTVIGPQKKELAELQTAHDKWLKENKDKIKPEAALVAYVDESVANLSSIVLLAEFGGKSMLLTGDARGDKILEGLELAGIMKKGGAVHVDLLKVPHHGSSNNLDVDFFERITADHYVFSGNGEHGNPERETLEMLLAARGNKAYKMHFTYPITEIDAERKKATKEPWLPKKDSLAAFFKDNPAFGKKVKVVEKGKPYLIDLLDKFKLG